MKKNGLSKFYTSALCIIVLVLSSTIGFAVEGIIEFTDENWDLSKAQLSEYNGRQALSGSAQLKGVIFGDGVIEVDIAVDDARMRAYPGLIFRSRDKGMGEHLYIRPHRAPLYADALQYAPVFNGESCWQFCNGPGYTNAVNIPGKQWNHLKLEIKGKQARVYWNDDKTPALVITDLKHGPTKGSIQLSGGPVYSPVYFSNFRYNLDNNLVLESTPEIKTPEGMIRDWEVSRSYPADKINLAEMTYPQFFVIANARFVKVKPDWTGLVNISELYKRRKFKPEIVFARTTFQSETSRQIRLDFGYSDEVLLFLNGQPVFYGNSAYRRRDPSFLGIMGLHDTVYLDLEKGRNEIFCVVKEYFGGWGFMAKSNKPLGKLKKDHRLTKAWEVSTGLSTPESVIYDTKRDRLYVTNFNPRFIKNATEDQYKGYISILSTEGKVIKGKWVTGLHAPTGMAIYKKNLYTLERRDLCVIDVDKGKVEKRYPIPGIDFPNDLTVDKKGDIYISDTAVVDLTKGKIIRFSKGKFETWLEGKQAWRPNAMYYSDNKLIFGGASGDPFVKIVDPVTKYVRSVGSLGAGTIDGLRLDKKGNILVSHWEGRIYEVSRQGDVVEIFDAQGELNTADFEYIPEKNLIVIPGFYHNKVVAYTLKD